MLDASRNAKHLVRLQRHFSARQLEAPTAFQHQNHLFIFVTVSVSDRALLNLDAGHGEAFAIWPLSLVEFRNLFRFHLIPIA